MEFAGERISAAVRLAAWRALANAALVGAKMVSGASGESRAPVRLAACGPGGRIGAAKVGVECILGGCEVRIEAHPGEEAARLGSRPSQRAQSSHRSTARACTAARSVERSGVLVSTSATHAWPVEQGGRES